MMGDIIVFGASRGLGAALAEGVPEPGEKVWCVSRTQPALLSNADGRERAWIAHDLADPTELAAALSPVACGRLDLLVYNAGIWERASLEKTDDKELRAIVDVNLTSLLISVRTLLPALRRGRDPRVVLIGSTCGLENEGTTSVAYAATKFAVRGAAHALREVLRSDGISATVISPGSMATDVALGEGTEAALVRHKGKRIPVSDLVETVRFLRRLSRAACVKEIDMPALADTDA
ncbi:MAG: SDR family oxidoreductase [Hyphomicrobiaceae bacterium]|nr:SDR family oxidoreductase [Hyphomicrobiaceae bacterium]